MTTSRSNKKSVILIGHGSREKGFETSMVKVARDLFKTKKYEKVLCAYLEITKPSIEEAVDVCVNLGAQEILLMPYFLLGGRHVKTHIPEILALARHRHQGVCRIKLSPYLGYDKSLSVLVQQRLTLAR